jgi:hypothetical protein
MKKIGIGILILLIVQSGNIAIASTAGYDELVRKARALEAGEKYSEAMKTYEQLLPLAQNRYGKKHVKVAEVLIAMSLVARYGLHDEKKYDELQGRAKAIKMTLNGTLRCREPAEWSYEPCRERWLGQDPCFQFTDYRNYIKVTYYGLNGSAFKTPRDLTKRLKDLFGKFEIEDGVKIDGRDARRIKLRYESGGRYEHHGKYLPKEFQYEEFIVLPLARGFLSFNFKLNNYGPIPGTFSKEEATENLYGDAYKNYQTWSSFLKSCFVTEGAKNAD